ncbi:unnamed protein product [Dovyalis caffra]|uniref:Cytochrome P450 n=1 Tax=Dovyalis caffra TaxID=77055 RepID=A0AAV1RBM4_9ROSI|nr:unnamed protein product [Dovyalis caffra]
MKKLCLTELLGARQLERSRSVRREELVRFLRKVLEKAKKNEVADVSQDNDVEKCVDLVRESFQLVAKMTLANLLGPSRKIGIFCFRKQLLDVPRRFDELLERILEEHEERARRDGGDREDKDLMDIVLEVYHDKNAEVKISRVQMKSFFLRFLLVSSEEEADDKMGRKGQDFNFWSFGGGRRKCPGVNLAFSLINATVAAMVQCFDWKVDGNGDVAKVNMEVTSGVTMSMAHPLLCLPQVHFNPFDTPVKDN